MRGSPDRRCNFSDYGRQQRGISGKGRDDALGHYIELSVHRSVPTDVIAAKAAKLQHAAAGEERQFGRVPVAGHELLELAARARKAAFSRTSARDAHDAMGLTLSRYL